MSRAVDQKIYQTFEEFEREELRRDSYFDSGYEIIDEMFAGDASEGGARKAGGKHDADEEE
jgi:hypothetical protein